MEAFSSAAVFVHQFPSAPSVCSALFLGSVVENGWVFACGVRGVLKIPDVGVTKVRELFVGSGDRAKDESDTPEMSRDSENTSGREISWSVTCEGFSSFTRAPQSRFLKWRNLLLFYLKEGRKKIQFFLSAWFPRALKSIHRDCKFP